MYPASETFFNELKGDYESVIECDIVFQGEVVAEDIQVLSGNVMEDTQAAVRRRCNLTLSGVDPMLLLPGSSYDESPLWPIGNELSLRAGVRYKNGAIETIPLGLFRISKPRLVVDSNDFRITIDAYDRSRTISRNRFTDSYVVALATDYATSIKTIIQDRMPILADADFVFMKTDGTDGGPVYTTPALIFAPQDDPWEAVRAMATAIGAELFFDGSGKCVLRPQADPLFTPPVWEYISGPTSLLEGLGRDLDDETAYNGVIAVGQNTDNALVPRGEAWDTSPTSPTYYDPNQPHLSVYGAVPYFYTSEYFTTNAQCVAAAQGLLVKVLGVLESVDLGMFPNPAHEGNDVIKITEPNTGVDAVYLLDQFNLGLGFNGTMTGTTRKRRVT